MQKLIAFDWAIKRILRSKANFEVLEGFLSELIAPDKDVKIIQVLESESNKETKRDKLNRVDILVEIVPGEIVLIEIQFNKEIDFLQRMLYGTSKIISQYLNEAEPYANVKKVYSINILHFDLGEGEDYIYKGTMEFVGIHDRKQLRLAELQRNTFHREFAREIYPEYHVIMVNRFNDIAKNTLDEWIYFLKNEEIKSEFKAKGLIKAKQVLDMLKLSKKERAAYERYQDNRHYEASMMLTKYIEGKAEGKAETMESVANNMLLKLHLDMDIVEKATGLPRTELEKIIQASMQA